MAERGPPGPHRETPSVYGLRRGAGNTPRRPLEGVQVGKQHVLQSQRSLGLPGRVPLQLQGLQPLRIPKVEQPNACSDKAVVNGLSSTT
jgi:hypothetical protein